MKRKNLRTKLAEVISATMRGHQLTIPNLMRYCNADVRASFSIRRSTTIKLEDWKAAIELTKPIKNVPKVNSTPTQPLPKLDWRERRIKRVKQLIRPDCLEYQTRMDLILGAPSEEVYFTQLKAWKKGLLDTVSIDK